MPIQIDMEMPECCRECRFRTCFWYEYLCGAKLFREKDGGVLIKNLDERPSWCPLQEVK